MAVRSFWTAGRFIFSDSRDHCRRDRRDLPGTEFISRPGRGGEYLRWTPADYQRRADRLAKTYEEAGDLLTSLGVQLDLKQKARSLSIAQQQMVEIARAFSINARILIMDEPTSSLTLSEVADLFRLVHGCATREQQLFSSPTDWKSYSKWQTGSPSCEMAIMSIPARCKMSIATN